jgi:hypothetical protein
LTESKRAVTFSSDWQRLRSVDPLDQVNTGRRGLEWIRSSDTLAVFPSENYREEGHAVCNMERLLRDDQRIARISAQFPRPIGTDTAGVDRHPSWRIVPELT